MNSPIKMTPEAFSTAHRNAEAEANDKVLRDILTLVNSNMHSYVEQKRYGTLYVRIGTDFKSASKAVQHLKELGFSVNLSANEADWGDKRDIFLQLEP